MTITDEAITEVSRVTSTVLVASPTLTMVAVASLTKSWAVTASLTRLPNSSASSMKKVAATPAWAELRSSP